MGVLARLAAAGRALVTPTTRADVGYLHDAGWITTNGTNVGEIQYSGRQARLAWERHPIVQACVRLIVDHLAVVPLEVYRDTPDGPENLPAHALQTLLDNPTPAMPAGRFRALTGMHVLLYGMALWHEVRGDTPAARRFVLPHRLDLIHPERMRFAWYDEDADMVARWDWSAEHTGEGRTALATDIVHFADYAGDNWLLGYPRAAAALGDIGIDHDASTYVREVLTNDGSPTLVFHLNDLASQDVANVAEEVWQQKRAARGMRGRAAFMSGTVKVEQLGFSLNDLEFPDLRRVAREDICTVFGVDPRMLGIASAGKDAGLSGEQYREARRRLIAQAVTPLMCLMEGQINHWLAPEFGTVKVRFSPDGLTELTENELETSTKAVNEFAAGVRTWEETRAVVGLPGTADPVQHLVAPASLRTVARALEMAAQEPPDPSALLAADADEAVNGSAPPADTTMPSGDAGEADQRTVVPPPAPRTGLTPEQRVAEWRAFDARARSDEAAYERAALGQFATESALVSRVLAGTTRQGPDPVLTPGEADALIAAINDLFRVGGEAHQGWVERFAPLEVATGVTAGEATLARLGVTFDLGVDPAFRAALEARVGRLAGFVTEETARQITDAILAGRAQGLGVRGIGELISDTVFGGFEVTRATRIARTETVGAVNEAEWRAARASGVVRSKEWLTQGDDRVRDTHADQDGLRIGMAEPFPNGLLYPHEAGADASEVVNCRCALFYSAEPPGV